MNIKLLFFSFILFFCFTKHLFCHLADYEFVPIYSIEVDSLNDLAISAGTIYGEGGDLGIFGGYKVSGELGSSAYSGNIGFTLTNYDYMKSSHGDNVPRLYYKLAPITSVQINLSIYQTYKDTSIYSKDQTYFGVLLTIPFFWGTQINYRSYNKYEGNNGKEYFNKCGIGYSFYFD